MGNTCDKMDDGLWLGDKDVYGDYSDGPEPDYKRFGAIVSALTDEEVERWGIRQKVANHSWLHISIDDSMEENISQHFRQVIDFVENARAKGQSVLIHCAAGISRSSTLVIAYLMWKHSWTRKEAVEYVVERRRIVDPNDGFMDQLGTFEREIHLSSIR
jgi:dual specificity MAP kinase phosphatase